MKGDIQKILKHENGISLIEVLVSVVLLTLILTTFFNVFLQSATINKTSEEIIDATYIAQKEMEMVYAKSLEIKYESRESAFPEPYEKKTRMLKDGVEWTPFEKPVEESGYHVRIRLQTNPLNLEESSNKQYMSRIIVEVFEGKITEDETNLQAKMENVLEWRANSE